MLLKDLFQVKSRFHRSIQIELDSSLDDYILTQTGLKIIRRIAESLQSKYTARAWTITGPYGSGKSAFIVYLKALFGNSTDPYVVKARDLLNKSDKNTHKQLFNSSAGLSNSKKGFCNAFVSAGREKIELSILKALKHGVEDFLHDNSAKKQVLLREFKKLIENAEKGQIPSSDKIIEYCEKVLEEVTIARGAGLLLVIDELGKCLEAAALNPDNDIFILQKLAEIASRNRKCPFILITVLHQSFDRYAGKLDTDKRNEWSKIQGRFEDVSFIDTSDQVFSLISSAIERLPSHKSFIKSAEKTVQSIADILKEDHHRSSKNFLESLSNCIPLHPLTTIVVVPLFRSKFTQNERSLFAFLTSTEHGGFADFLSKTSVESKLPLYSLTHLYDYLTACFGTSLFTQNNGKKWIEIDNALSRSTDSVERKIIKVIGVLNLFGESNGFPINEAIIKCALSTEEISDYLINQALKNLSKKSLIIFRKYSNSYVLWGGSDIDIEKKIQETKTHSVSSLSIVDALNKLFQPRPKIAKRYLYETGTLRYFKVYYSDLSNLTIDLQKPLEDADGQVILVLNTSNEKIKSKDISQKLASSPVKISQRTLIGVANDASKFINMFSELLSLQHIRRNTPELQGDPVALREIEARLIQMERAVNESIDELFFFNSDKSQPTHWVDIENVKTNISKKEVSVWISDISNRVYKSTPILKNELINRNRMSSTSMGARRMLLNFMLENSSQPNLDIKGYPPEFCMYQSVLKSSGLHHQISTDQWKFTNDVNDLHPSWKPLWKAIEAYLVENETRRVPVLEIFDLIQKPPFGIKEGVLPVLFLAILKAYDTEIAFFEQGTFKPIVKASDIELVTKVPQRYSVQLCRISGVKAVVFDEIVNTFIQYSKDKKFNLLQIVKMLCSFISTLPLYVQNTNNLSSSAKAVRKCLLESIEPANLLFKDLPKSLGLEPIGTYGHFSEEDAKNFVIKLKNSLSELQRKEVELYHKIEIILFHTYGINDHKKEDREVLSERTKNIISVTMDPTLKGFLVRVADTLDHKAWLDSIGTVITGRPPLSWSDEDLLSFEHHMSSLSQKITRYERLALEAGKNSLSGREIRQLSISSNLISELSTIIHIDSGKEGDVNEVEQKLSSLLNDLSSKEGEGVVLTALTNFIIKNLSTKGSNLPTERKNNVRE